MSYSLACSELYRLLRRSGAHTPVIDNYERMAARLQNASTPRVDNNLTICATGQQFTARYEDGTVAVGAAAHTHTPDCILSWLLPRYWRQ